jgi:3'-5' exoribonuclease
MPEVERIPLYALKEGQTAEFFAVIVEIQEKTTKSNDPFFRVVLRDQKRNLPANVWFNSPFFDVFKRNWKVGQHLRVRATLDKKFNNLNLLEVKEATDADREFGYDPRDFENATRFDAEEMFAELLEFAKKIADKPLRTLVLNLLEGNAEKFKRQPAASRNHHAYRGGLLEHTLSVVRTGEYLSKKYAEYYPDLAPPLNRDLILAGCLLHDIGKLEELEATAENIQYTKVGNLVGHVIVGRDMVREAARGVQGLDPELLLLLEHIVLSHQLTKEFDSPKEPAFPEALLVHFADDIDAKMNMYVTILDATPEGNEFSDSNNIFRRKLLKQRNS